MSKANNHYDFIEQHGPAFSRALGVENIENYSLAHGDKCYSYKMRWQKAGVPFAEGVMIYLLSYLPKYSKTVRQTEVGWIDPAEWVIYMHQQPSIRDAIVYAKNICNDFEGDALNKIPEGLDLSRKPSLLNIIKEIADV